MNIDQAYNMLKKAGVSESIRTLTVRRWIREGKIIDENTGDNRFIKDEKVSKRFYNSSTNQDKDEIIRQLKLKLKVKDEHIEGIEDLHEAGKKLLLLDRKKLNREIVILKNEKNNLQNEIENLLKENRIAQ